MSEQTLAERAADPLSDRMQTYEQASRYRLPRRMPVIIRVDGKAFHSWTRGLERPFSLPFVLAMNAVATSLCEEIQGAQLAYVQSDEISVLLHNYKKLATDAWLDNRVEKMSSIAASIAASQMTLASTDVFGHERPRPAYFDARVFVLPEAEVCNYFIWRQQDATRNSIQMLAQSLYSPREMHKKNTDHLQEMTCQKGQNWNDLPTHLKRGRCVVKEGYKFVEGERGELVTRHRWVVDQEPPIFSKERDYVNRHLEVEPEAKATDA